MKLIKQYLNEDQSSHKGEIDEDTRAAIRGFFTKSFECNKGMLCEGYFNGVMTLGNCTTGVSEAEHRAYKNSATCLGPGDDLAESTDKLIIRAETKDAVKGRSMTHQIRSHSGKADDRYKQVPSEMARNEDDDVVRAVGLKVDAYQNFLPFYSE